MLLSIYGGGKSPKRRRNKMAEKTLDLSKKSRPRRAKLRAIDKVFIIVMLAIPVVHWFIFWLYVNFNSILMAFQIPTGEWSMASIEQVIRDLSMPENSELVISVINTVIYFVITPPRHG